jgi:lipid A 3-O-deacylase
MKTLHRKYLVVSLAFLSSVRADLSPDFWRLHLENDAFTANGTDRYYTHGTRIEAVYAPGRTPEYAKGFRNFIAADASDTVLSLFLAQYLYTPNDIRLHNPPLDDRPYGGWLNLGMQTAVRRGGRRFDVQDVVSVGVGVVGRMSGAEYSQKLIHSVRKLQWPNGWETQLPNEPVIDVLLERKWKWRKVDNDTYWSWEALPHLSANVGTVFVMARSGLMLRTGFIQDDFGFAPIRPSAPTQTKFGAAPQITKSGVTRNKWTGHIFVAVEGRLVGHNTFIDGTVFHDSRSTKREPWVGDFILGGTIARGHLALTYAYVVRTKEFRAQKTDQEFGAISIDFRRW